MCGASSRDGEKSKRRRRRREKDEHIKFDVHKEATHAVVRGGTYVVRTWMARWGWSMEGPGPNPVPPVLLTQVVASRPRCNNELGIQLRTKWPSRCPYQLPHLVASSSRASLFPRALIHADHADPQNQTLRQSDDCDDAMASVSGGPTTQSPYQMPPPACPAFPHLNACTSDPVLPLSTSLFRNK